MKNITKYILAAAAAFSSLTACQEFEDFDKTIDGTPGLVYVQTGTENLYTIRVVHKPTGSTGEFFTEFPVRCNTTRHAGVKATFVYDASLVESYNAEHKTSYAALPAEYLTLENTTLTVPENATASADSVKVTLTGDLSLLTERNYFKDPGLNHTLAGDGTASIIAGFVGGPPVTSYGENIGVLAITRVHSVYVLAGAALFAVFFSFVGKLSALIESIPGPVIGGISFLLFGVIASSGLRVMIEDQIDFNKKRNLMISSVILVIGIGNAYLKLGQYQFSGLAVAAVLGIVLNLILPDEAASERKKNN